jgi:hypothetical protein
MNINVHIERLILDGLPVARHEGPLVQAAVEAELARLLAVDGLANSLMSGGATSAVSGPEITLRGNHNPARLGQQIARAVYHGLNSTK